ncbi:small subunit ribosomal protein S7 [Mytilus galloprovincialis]|uniref:Small subunit ribosomal protein S7 n=1 Tax=Mytilus galloprovincialis TaxID=29158 RepID=A0A8B6E118_MYTGA|nr:small subunit ribosomal protein S7 [Mytilus galloprovincialis]
MALCKGKLLFQYFLNNHINHARFLSFTQSNLSRYAKDFIDPIVEKEELSKPLDEFDTRRHRPVKAARTEETIMGDQAVQKFINIIMRDGKKDVARSVIDQTFANIKRKQIERYHRAPTQEEKEKIELDPVKIFHQAYENCKPVLYTRTKVHGGFKYKVPCPCEGNTQSFKSMKFLITAAEEKDKRIRMWKRLSLEIIDASRNEGVAIRKKQNLHRECQANRAYSHFRWSK